MTCDVDFLRLSHRWESFCPFSSQTFIVLLLKDLTKLIQEILCYILYIGTLERFWTSKGGGKIALLVTRIMLWNDSFIPCVQMIRVENNSHNPKTSSLIIKASSLKIQSFSESHWRGRNYSQAKVSTLPSLVSRKINKYVHLLNICYLKELDLWHGWQKKNPHTQGTSHAYSQVLASNL